VKAALDRGETPQAHPAARPPGLGKTTFAHLVGQMINEWRAERDMAPITVHVTSASNLRTTKNLAKVLSKVQAGDVLFIDECHRMTSMTEEMLGLAMMPPYTFVIPRPRSSPAPRNARSPWRPGPASAPPPSTARSQAAARSDGADRAAQTLRCRDMSEILRRAASGSTSRSTRSLARPSPALSRHST